MKTETIENRVLPNGTKVDRPGRGVNGLIERVNEHRARCKEHEYERAELVVRNSHNPTAVMSAIFVEQSVNAASQLGMRVWNYAKGLVARTTAQDHLSVTERDAQEANSSELRPQRTSTEPNLLWGFLRSLGLLPKSDEEITNTMTNPFAKLISPEQF